MEYTFSWGAFFVGFLILAASGALVIWHRQIADNLGSGLASYEKYRLYGLIGCGVGFLVMLNVHSLLFTWILSMLFNRGG